MLGLEPFVFVKTKEKQELWESLCDCAVGFEVFFLFNFFYKLVWDRSAALGLREAMGLGFLFFWGMFFMFKICVNGERDKYHFLILFLLHFCSIFCFGRRET